MVCRAVPFRRSPANAGLFSEYPWPGAGGQIGFRATHGVVLIHHFTLETDADQNGVWTTEYDGTYNHPGGYATVQYEHDTAGNLTFDGIYAYTYDAWNRLVQVRNAYRDTSGTVQTGSVITAMAYDGLGRRITKAVQNHGDHNGVQHAYYDGQRQVEERNGSDLVMQQRIWGLSYIDELIAVSTNFNPYATAGTGYDQDPNPQLCDAEHFAVHDAQYNVIGLVGISPEVFDSMIGGGAWHYVSVSPRNLYDSLMDGQSAITATPLPVRVVERYEYTPYGQRQVYVSDDDIWAGGYGNDPKALTPALGSQRLASGMGFNAVGHQGLHHDEATGLVYNRARMLHPGLGRFMQRDPLGYVDGMSVYGYYAGMRGTVDPSGLVGPLSVPNRGGGSTNVFTGQVTGASPGRSRQTSFDVVGTGTLTGDPLEDSFANIFNGHTDITRDGITCRVGRGGGSGRGGYNFNTNAGGMDILETWSLRRNRSGTLQYGSGAGTCCKEATEDQIAECLGEVPFLPGSYNGALNNCQHDVANATSRCCLTGFLSVVTIPRDVADALPPPIITTPPGFFGF